MPNYKLYYFKSLTSTQDKAKDFSKKGIYNAVIIADVQTQGRGRLKRKWHSAKGGLWMSILIKPKNICNLQYLTFAAAAGVVKSIKKIAGIKANIKWPNDIHCKGKKICGILTEGIFGKENYAAVGFGLNINQIGFPHDIGDSATSLRIIKNKKINIEKLSKSIITNFFGLYYDYYNQSKFEYIIKIWGKNCDTINKDVKVMIQKRNIYGKAVGIDEKCSLLLKLKNNKIIRIVEGDLKVRY